MDYFDIMVYGNMSVNHSTDVKPTNYYFRVHNYHGYIVKHSHYAAQYAYLVYYMKILYNKLMPILQITLNASDKQSVTDYVNQYRALHDAPPLIWDETIANFADSWSAYLLKNSAFYHSNNKLYGENLAYFQGYNATPIELIKKSIDLWYAEISMYDFNASQYTSGTGHFTCLVWKASRLHGFGYSYNTTTQEVVISMNTSPPGNIIGQFKENVLPLKDGSVPVPVPMPNPLPEPTPIPIPLPEPTPIPIPLPEPTPAPLPDYKLIKREIVTKIYDAINKIQQQYPRYIITNVLTDIYNQVLSIPDRELYTKYNIINALKNSISAMRYRYSPYVIIRVLNNVINDLHRSLF